MEFEFATAARIIFGPGRVDEAGAIAAEMGRRALVVHDGSEQRSSRMVDILKGAGLGWNLVAVSGEPTAETALTATEEARRAGCDVVVGIGGGSVIDAGKAVAALLTNGGEPLDYVEVIGKGKTIKEPSAPYIAIPTTAGTGAEVTKNAVLRSPEKRVKVSMRSALLLPRVALVDPLLTHSMPREVTASTGLDALSQLVEPFVSKRANALTDGICREGLRRVARWLRQACEDGSDARAREEMSLASLFGGLALANAGLGAAHGFAAAIGGMFPAPHGLICARMLPAAVEANVKALRERAPKSEALNRFGELGRILTGDPKAGALEGAEWIRELCGHLKLPPLSEFGVKKGDFGAIVEKAQRASSMKGNPVELTGEELEQVLHKAAG